MPVTLEAIIPSAFNATDNVMVRRGAGPLDHTIQLLGSTALQNFLGLAAIATSGSASDLGAGTLPSARFDDTAHGARAGGTLHANAVAAGAAGFMTGADKTKLDGIAAGAQVNVPTNLTYNATTRVIASDTGTDATLPLATTTDAGLAPARSGVVTDFLNGTGGYSTPAGGGSPGGASGEVQYNNAGAFAGAADVEIEGGQLRLLTVASPATPASGGIKVLGRNFAGFSLPAFMTSDGKVKLLDSSRGEFDMSWFFPSAGNNSSGDATLAVSAIGTSTAAAPAATNLHTMMTRVDYRVTVAATTAQAGLRTAANPVRVGRDANAPGGFLVQMLWGPATGVSVTTTRGFCGVRPTAVGSDVEPSTFINIIGMAWDAADTNIQMMHNDGAGTATKIDLGASFPVPTTDRTQVYELQLYSPNSTTQSVSYRVIRYNTTGKTIAAEASGTITTDLPAVTTFLGLRTSMSVGGTSSVIGVAIGGWLIGTQY